MADPAGTDPEDRDPREVDLSRRANEPAISPWMVVGLIALIGLVVYAVSAIL